jgi:hypothetical protein
MTLAGILEVISATTMIGLLIVGFFRMMMALRRSVVR